MCQVRGRSLPHGRSSRPSGSPASRRVSGPGAIADELAVAREEMLQRRRTRQVSGIVGVELLPPVSGMGPDEVEGLDGGEVIRIAGVETLMDVPREAGEAEFIADVAAGAAASHWVQNQGRLEIQQKILDEVAAAVAGLASVAVLAGSVEVVQAGQVRHGTRISGCEWQPSIDGSVTLLCSRRDPFQAAGIEGIGGVGCVVHGISLLSSCCWSLSSWM